MPYIDFEYYVNEYEGIQVQESDFSKLAKRASEIIDELTDFKIKDFNNLKPFQQDRIKKATAILVEFYAVNGYENTIIQSPQSVTLGSFSLSVNPQNKSFPEKVYTYLVDTGLFHKGIGVI